ncbi:hypothetical protein [Actinoplanes sp. NPDC026670]|uniref:hypothetical protein n=1 Tax=Actinoplanes sp. NPDC026670 TaxID=3154700 RepID=UPI0033F77A4E
MTTEALPGEDPRRLLSDTRALAHRVRRDQRVTWAALLVLAVVTFLAIPADYYGMDVQCTDDWCRLSRDGVVWFWPPALLLAYTAIAYWYVRIARSRGVGARVLPYAYTGAALALLYVVVWVVFRIWVDLQPQSVPQAEWTLALDRLVAPAGTIGIALLVLAWLERNPGLLAFTVVYLAAVLAPIRADWLMGANGRGAFVPEQVFNGVVLLLGAAVFALARRWRR